MIHTIWFGGAPKSDLLLRCADSWPQLRAEWRAFPPGMVPYFYEAIEAKHWAAASDVMRLHLLHEYGGVYLDADVEVLQPQALSCMLMSAHIDRMVIIGKEDAANVCGAVIIAPPRHPFITRMLDVYAGLKFSDTFEGSGGTVNGTTLLTREVAGRDDVQLEEASVFHPIHWGVINDLSIEERHAVVAEFESVTLHHFAHQWGKK